MGCEKSGSEDATHQEKGHCQKGSGEGSTVKGGEEGPGDEEDGNAAYAGSGGGSVANAALRWPLHPLVFGRESVPLQELTEVENTRGLRTVFDSTFQSPIIGQEMDV